ncbi:MAG: integral rane sensor signal transduction histidine kinase [Gammaproteobacteria bacterium]|nr:integral rane sensor signal transduction histidine kinase [Gammaproteobacteria bacterium]
MKFGVWPADTIARRFVVAEVLTIGATLALVGLFRLFGGVWSQEPLDRTGLLTQATDLVRVIEAAPAALRATLAAAATTNDVHVDWYAAASPASASFDGAHERSTDKATKEISTEIHRVAVAFGHDQRMPIPAGVPDAHPTRNMPYVLAVRLSDHSWVTFSLPNRMWGLPGMYRWIVVFVFIAVSTALVSAVTARQFAKPVKRLAEAVRNFGTNPQAPPMAETGPRELRQVVRTFNAMQAQIQQFVGFRTMMLAAISHDLRTPLTRIRLRGEFIEDRDQQSRLFRDVDEMQTMVDGALAFFRDDAVSEGTTTFDLPQLLLTIANDYADQGIELGYTGPAHATYQGRPFALKRAVTNLIENAVQYATVPDIELTREGTAFVVAVQDRGPGIPMSALDSVFHPYHRLDKSRNRSTGGVGLGLTVAQAIVQGHGGEIILRNRLGGGLEARVILPLAA